MPRILRVELTSDQEREVRVRLPARDLAPGDRPRLDRMRLMGRGLTVPDVADLLERDEITVRGEYGREGPVLPRRERVRPDHAHGMDLATGRTAGPGAACRSGVGEDLRQG